MADTTYFPDATGSVMSAAPRAVGAPRGGEGGGGSWGELVA